MEEITALVEREIEKRTQERITAFIERISVTYDISMKVLLREFSRVGVGEVIKLPEQKKQCLGVTTSSRKRCKFTAGPCGYCKKHMDQYKPPPPTPRSPTRVDNFVRHTHTIPPLFDKNCPACINIKNAPKDNLLINI